MGFFKSLGNIVKQVAPIATTAGMAYLTGGSSLAAGGVGSSLLSSLGSGEGMLGSLGGLLGTTGSQLLSGVVEGAVGLGQDYLTQQQQLSQKQNIADIELKNNLALADKQFENQKAENYQVYKQNKALADQAYQQNVAMWNMQNDYDAPAQQMARLQQAGLNPNLVYGSGHVTGNTASSAPQYAPPSLEAAQYNSPAYKLGLVDSYQKIENQAIQNNVLRQQLWNLRVDTHLKSAMNNSVVQLNKAKKDLTEAITRGHNMDNAGYKRQLNNMLGGLLGLFTGGTGGETPELI